MLNANPVKQKLDAGQLVVGCFQSIYSPSHVEMLGHAGFDFVVLDSEHGPHDVLNMQLMATAADAVGIVPLIRVAYNDPSLILKALDLGAYGIHIPHVSTRAAAEKAVECAYYPPLGQRGISLNTRAAQYGFVNPVEYTEQANQRTLTVAQIESVEAVENLDAILSVPGIDVYFIGIADLAQSLGSTGNVKSPVVQDTVNYIINNITYAHKVVGTFTPDIDSAQKWIDRGVRYVTTHSNSLLKKSMGEFLKAVRS